MNIKKNNKNKAEEALDEVISQWEHSGRQSLAERRQRRRRDGWMMCRASALPRISPLFFPNFFF